MKRHELCECTKGRRRLVDGSRLRPTGHLRIPSLTEKRNHTTQRDVTHASISRLVLDRVRTAGRTVTDFLTETII